MSSGSFEWTTSLQTSEQISCLVTEAVHTLFSSCWITEAVENKGTKYIGSGTSYSSDVIVIAASLYGIIKTHN